MVNTIIIGASTAGLACAAVLTKKKISYQIFEKEETIAPTWRRHYDRLHIHTAKYNSHLPYVKFPSSYPVFPSKHQLIDYYEKYQKQFDIQPNFKEEVSNIRPENGKWLVTTTKGEYEAKNIILATGLEQYPFIPTYAGMDDFVGEIMHSADYKNGKRFKDKRVLVVGFGNSACEIALDLYEQGASSYMSVRGAVNIVPRDVGGIPTSMLGLLTSWLPPHLQDKIGSSTLNPIMKSLKPYGIKQLPYGPATQVTKYGKAPALDVGTIEQIKQENIKILPAIEYFSPEAIQFSNGEKMAFDTVIFGTGYQPKINKLITGVDGIIDDASRPNVNIRSELRGLYYCGFKAALNGLLRLIRKNALQIGDWIEAEQRQ